MTRPDQDCSPTSTHQDAGLQPERTVLALGRTVLALSTAAAICLRRVTRHGVFALTLFTVAVATGAAIYLSQRARYARTSRGITDEKVAIDARGVLGLAAATAVPGLVGLYVVLVLA